MVIINPLEDKAIKEWAKRVFKDVDLMPKGFAIEFVNVKLSRNYIHISNFDEAPPHKLTESVFYKPETFQDLVKKLIHHCGEEKIVKQLKPNITLMP